MDMFNKLRQFILWFVYATPLVYALDFLKVIDLEPTVVVGLFLVQAICTIVLLQTGRRPRERR